MAASVAVAQPPVLDDVKRAALTDCGSVVIVTCDRHQSQASAAVEQQAREQSRRTELRRQTAGIQQLEGVVIEGDAVRRRSIEETMGGPFPAVRARDGNYTFETGEGTQCTCMNVCPPWPLPCCTCSGHMNRYRAMPGSSPLN